MAKYDEIKKQLKAAIADNERELRRLRTALEAIESADSDVSRNPVERRPRRSAEDVARLRQLAMSLISASGGRATARDVHLAFVQAGELEDTKQDLEVARNLLKGLVRERELDECGGGNYCLPDSDAGPALTAIPGGSL